MMAGETLDPPIAGAPAEITDARRMADLRGAYDAVKAARYADIPAFSRVHADRGDIEHSMLLAFALAFADRVDEAASLFARVAEARPFAMHPMEELARLMREADRELDALPHAEAAVRLRPHDTRAMVVLGSQLCLAFRPDEAEAVLRRALALEPRSSPVLNHLGIALTDQGRYGAATEMFRRAAEIDPGNNTPWTNLACTLAIENRFDEALEYYRRSIVLRPDQPAIRVNHAICLLKAGRMVQGWAEYEFRLQMPGHTKLPADRLLPNLADATRLADDSIVMVTHEEGLGDTLQFMRYLAPLRDRGAKVIAWVPETLRSLVGRVPGVDAFSGSAEGRAYSAHCPFLSLPRVFSATGDALPTDPYIVADPGRMACMAAQLPPGDRLRVGLVWGGDPRRHVRAAHAIDRKRSIDVGALRHLATLQRTAFVSLQFGPHRDELRDLAPGLAIHDPMGAVGEMDDTAALMMHLDVVVSVDTSMVHLAAGLGRPVILLDRYDNCWRWAAGRDDSPFYPSLRIIRQARPGDWESVGVRLVEALRIMEDAHARGRAPSVHAAINAITPYPTTVPT